MKKYYIYALDVKKWVIVAALSCPDESVAQEVFRIACQDLDGCGGSHCIEYGIACVGVDALIEHKLPTARGWLGLWWKEEKLYRKDRFDRREFESAELQTKASVFRTRHYKEKVFEHYTLFMSFVALALEELTRKKSSANVKPASTLPVASLTDCSYQIQAASGSGVPAIIESYNDTIDAAEAPAEVNVMNLKDILRVVYIAILRAIMDSKNPDEKYNHYVMYESGMDYMDIAKSENPDWESEYGRDEARKRWARESEKIRKQVTRMIDKHGTSR